MALGPLAEGLKARCLAAGPGVGHALPYADDELGLLPRWLLHGAAHLWQTEVTAAT